MRESFKEILLVVAAAFALAASYYVLTKGLLGLTGRLLSFGDSGVPRSGSPFFLLNSSFVLIDGYGEKPKLIEIGDVQRCTF
jgi:hypothetical protein